MRYEILSCGKKLLLKYPKKLAKYRSENIFVIDHQNNYVEPLMTKWCRKF